MQPELFEGFPLLGHRLVEAVNGFLLVGEPDFEIVKTIAERLIGHDFVCFTQLCEGVDTCTATMILLTSPFLSKRGR